VNDEFTVPLCSIHHYQIHVTGDEREWWQRQNLDPLQVAKRFGINEPKNLRLEMGRDQLRAHVIPAVTVAVPGEFEAPCAQAPHSAPTCLNLCRFSGKGQL
jgi:hypothetical protein